jgi:hypothetical protein
MAMKVQGGRMVPQRNTTFNATPIVRGKDAANRGLDEMTQGLKQLERVAAQSDNPELVAFVAAALRSMQVAKMAVADVSLGLRRFIS